MNDIREKVIQELLFNLLICSGFYVYKGFIIKSTTGKKCTFYRIYDMTFRMLYNSKITSVTQAIYIIDHYNYMLSNLSQLKPHDLSTFEYFSGGYNYYGELISDYGS